MLTEFAQRTYLARIERALVGAAAVAKRYVPGTFHVRDNGGREVITEVDRQVSDMLRGELPGAGEGWLSEEDLDDKTRLASDIVWVVDPLDGTREFVDGIPEWCISVGLVVSGVAIAGGVVNPATNELFLGSRDCGVTYNGTPTQAAMRASLDGALVLASRQEYNRGEWKRFEGRAVFDQAHGVRSLQIGSRFCRASRCDVDSVSKTRVGHRRRSRACEFRGRQGRLHRACRPALQ